MVSQVFLYKEILHDENFDVKEYLDGAVYKGVFKSVNGAKVRDGNGVMIYPNGRLYEGGWESD